MIVRVNGETREVDDGISVAALVYSLGIVAARIAVEVNREIVPKNAHAGHRLRDGDAVEIVTMVGGG